MPDTAPGLAAFQRRFAAALTGPPDPGAEAALRVYRNTALAGAVDPLAATYRTTAQVMGDDSFRHAAAGYAHCHRPATPVLALYGARFADWLAETGWASALPFLPDVARIDRFRAEAHVAADALPFDPAAHADWMVQRPGLHPATRFALFTTPALRIWAAHTDCEAPPRAFCGDGVLVTRPHGALRTTAIGPAHLLFLGEIAGGASIAAAAETASRAFPGVDLARLFATIISSGALAAVQKEP